MAREKEGETRRQAPEEEIYYGAYDFTGPAPDAMVDAMEADWLEEIEAELETQSLEEIFPELSMEELEAFELELKMLGYEDDGDWAVGIDPQNRPWRHSPRDDEDPGAAGSSKTHMNQNTQVYMMMGGGGPPPPPPQDHQDTATQNKNQYIHIGKLWRDLKEHP